LVCGFQIPDLFKKSGIYQPRPIANAMNQYPLKLMKQEKIQGE